MTRDRMDDLYRHAADLRLDVQWSDLGDYRRGEYRDDDKVIVLNRRLTRAQATATLAHEIGHAVFGDRCSTPAAERRAWRYGAALAISEDEYGQAESLVGCEAAALALELEVTPQLVVAWRHWYRQCSEKPATSP